MAQQMDNIEKGVNVFEKFLNMVAHNKFIDIIKTIGVIVLVSWAFILSTNPSIVFEAYEKFIVSNHNKAIEKRMEISEHVNLELDKLLLKTRAQRVYIAEFHNGTNNLNGLPFCFTDVTFERVEDDLTIEYIAELYKDIPNNRFPMIYFLYKNKYWAGTTDELKSIDKRLGVRMEVNGARYVVFGFIEGANSPIGLLGLSYSEIPQLPLNMKTLIMTECGKLGALLNK